MTKLLHAYENGLNKISLFSNGTKIREKLGSSKFPDHCDIKITDYCDAGCPFCHEQSTKRGIHGSIDWLANLLDGLPSGFELAIGGGNPLDHPDLFKLLEICKERGYVANITINQLHLKSHKQITDKLMNLVYGIGLSVRDVDSLKDENYLATNTNLVYHLILGVHSFQDFLKIKKREPESKILLLGYKQWGFGKKYGESQERSSDIKKKISQWRAHIPHILNISGVVSFDNLSIDQLSLQDWFEPDKWQEMFMGDDGEFSMYVDCCKREYAISSTNPNKLRVENQSIFQCFDNLNVSRK